MGVLDGPARSVSAQLIRRFGRRVVLRFVPEATYDPGARATVDEPAAELAVSALFESYRADAPALAEGADYTVTIAAADVDTLGAPFRAPTTRDLVIVDGAELRILHVDPVYSGDQVALYRLHVRR